VPYPVPERVSYLSTRLAGRSRLGDGVAYEAPPVLSASMRGQTPQQATKPAPKPAPRPVTAPPTLLTTPAHPFLSPAYPTLPRAVLAPPKAVPSNMPRQPVVPPPTTLAPLGPGAGATPVLTGPIAGPGITVPPPAPSNIANMAPVPATSANGNGNGNGGGASSVVTTSSAAPTPSASGGAWFAGLPWWVWVLLVAGGGYLILQASS
jgi:hypothetical protein